MKNLLSSLAVLLFATNLYAASATDDFNRADVTPVDGSWTIIGGYSSLVSNHVVPFALDEELIAAYNGVSFAADQSSQVTLVGFSGISRNGIGAVLRASDTGPVYYAGMAFINDSFGPCTTQIYSNVSGSYNSIACENATTWVATDTIKTQIRSTGFILFKNGVSLLTAPDDGAIASGQPGFILLSGDDTDTNILDDWAGTDSFVTAAIIRRRPIQQ